MEFQVQIEEDQDLKIFLEGDLDINSSPTLKVRVLEAYEAHPANLFFDFSKLNYLDSTGLGALISIYRNVTPNGHTITIAKTKPHIKKLFLITELDQDFQLED